MEPAATNQSSRRNHGYAMNMNMLDDEEQEALAALAEMPASPACRFADRRSEAMLEDSREALLEAYTSANGHMNGNGHGGYGHGHAHGHHPGQHHGQHGKSKLSIGGKRQWKRSFRSEPDLSQSSHTSESIMMAGRVFGGLMHAISARIGNGIHRTVSMPAQVHDADGLSPVAHNAQAHASNSRGQSPRGWSPHVWTSGVNPADAEPAIVQVPTSLIQKALVSPRYKQSDTTQGRTPPVPLFY